MEEKITFEKAMGRLEEVVRLLEAGDAPLDNSLALFEEGTALIKECSKLLDAAEQKVVMLTSDKEGNPQETEFQGGDAQ